MLGPIRLTAVGSLAEEPEGGVNDIALANQGSQNAAQVPLGLNPAGGASLVIGSWGTKALSTTRIMPVSEWCVLTEGEVTISNVATGHTRTFCRGDAFLLPKGLEFRWDQRGHVKKFYVKCDHCEPEMPPKETIAYDFEQKCTDTREGWFFCNASEQLQSGSVMPTSGKHSYFQDKDGQFSAGMWTCSAHATKEGSYPVNEFIYLIQGSIILTVAGKDHVFVAGDAFFIPKGLKCSWRQPSDVKKCYIIFAPQEAQPKSKM
eukprot:gnl/MRDRNA2_/MRDRNA2_79419_c0_seq1.p1 gnl/MRDRNA2_/MRDRNA2_79419_c0~~gnl/MRDRNA2_/MRDRNA2_79419_c0_seq1.p1  ORF type:complete len:261 (+),score=42.69 gnl/MRDRNA2_/MRDRNA2_79419_c0_seq1:78-860(+)